MSRLAWGTALPRGFNLSPWKSFPLSASKILKSVLKPTNQMLTIFQGWGSTVPQKYATAKSFPLSTGAKKAVKRASLNPQALPRQFLKSASGVPAGHPRVVLVSIEAKKMEGLVFAKCDSIDSRIHVKHGDTMPAKALVVQLAGWSELS